MNDLHKNWIGISIKKIFREDRKYEVSITVSFKSIISIEFVKKRWNWSMRKMAF